MTTAALTPGVHLVTSQSPNLSTVIDGIAHLHAACILHDHTLATFLPPLSHSQLYQWWEQRVAEVSKGERQIIIYLSPVNDRTTAKEKEIKAPWKDKGRDWPSISIPTQQPNPSNTPSSTTAIEVAGVVALETPHSQTGPFRAIVQKLFVSPLHRRQGIAKRMMSELESVALSLGKWNLMLDTEVGSAAESVYPRLGYERLGVVGEYGYSPKDGRLVDEVWFWKDLRRER